MTPFQRTQLLAVMALVSAALAIASAPWALGLPVLNYVFKPLTTLLVMAYAWPRGKDTPQVRRWVLVGLCFSLAGDVFLVWPKQGFLPGLVSFLIAHLAYLMAFTRTVPLAAKPWVFASYAALAGVILTQLWPGIPGALQLPVVAYVLCLAGMAAQAAVLWRQGLPRAGVLAVGGALFMASDTLLAVNKFVMPLHRASLWILATYWAAQWCIASGLRGADLDAGKADVP